MGHKITAIVFDQLTLDFEFNDHVLEICDAVFNLRCFAFVTALILTGHIVNHQTLLSYLIFPASTP